MYYTLDDVNLTKTMPRVIFIINYTVHSSITRLVIFFPESCFDLVKSALNIFKRQTGELEFAKYLECKYM
jgi:hypothetical protein